MRDKRPVDELSVEELERILMMKRREGRMQRFRGGNNARSVEDVPVPPPNNTLQTTNHAALATQQPQAIAPTDRNAEPVPQAAVELPRFEDDGVPQFEDDLPPKVVIPDREYNATFANPQAQKRNRRVLNGLLLVAEIGALVGLGALLLIAYQGITTVNDNIARTDAISATSEAELEMRRIQPTATPLISVSQVVLPGGHVYNESGQHQFNISEVPAPYRDAFRQTLDAPRQEFAEIPSGGPITIRIPAINVEASVRAGDDWISLQAGVGHHPNSGLPGQEGNMVLTGHNDIFGEIFKRLPELNPGDEIEVQSTNGQWYTYVVREKQAVDPTEVWVLDQGLGQGTPIATLITCYPYRVNTQRMIVFAELIN